MPLSKEKLEELITRSTDIIVATNRKGNIVYYNDGATRSLGYQQSEILDRYVGTVYPDLEEARRVMKAMRDPGHGGPGIVETFQTTFLDKDGHERQMARFKWWLADAATSLRNAAVIPKGSTTEDGRDYPPLPESPLETPPPVEPYVADVTVFYGHYWESGTPTITSNRTACVDYGVAAEVPGPLVAYRWQGESTLTNDHFVKTAEE